MVGLLKPAMLKPVDKVALIAPSSPVTEKVLATAMESIRFLGLRPSVYPSCRLSHGYMAGTDDARANDINTAFADKEVKGIFCIRGGYGAARILNKLNYEMIKANPKVFCGYSDITALHTVFNQMCGFLTFHSPMPNTGYRGMDDFSLKSLKRNIFNPAGIGKIKNPPGEEIITINGGTAMGIITGGNLSLLQSTLGSPYEIDTKGKILFIEEVDELPYKVDKALTALALAGKFSDCAGIILGAFSGCFENSPHSQENNDTLGNCSLTVNDIVSEVIKPFKKPTVLNLRAGHIYPQITIPMGSVASLDASQREIHFL